MRVQLDPLAEITLEANPGTVEAGAASAFREAGVNRLSVGIQSFDEHLQKRSASIHGGRAIAAAEAALTHFEAVNLDLMYALPGQTLAEAEADLATAWPSARPSVCYHLTLEPNTAFAANPPQVPGPGRLGRHAGPIEAPPGDAGYIHYETSAFARPDTRMPAQPQLLDFRRLPGHRRRRPRQAVVPRRHRPRDLAQAPGPPISPPADGSFMQERHHWRR